MAKAKSKYVVGGKVVFNGYGDDVPEDSQYLNPGDTYEIAEVGDNNTLCIEIDDPGYNPKKPVSDSNQPTILVEVLFDEVSPAEDEEEEAPAPKAKAKAAPVKAAPAPKGKAKAAPPEEEEGAEEAEEEAEEEEAEEAPAPKAKAKPAAKAKPEVKEKAAPAKAKPAAKGKAAPAAKGKASAKPAVKGKAAAKDVAPAAEHDADKYEELDNEDEDVLAMVNDSEDICALAQEMALDLVSKEYQLGGVLYHVLTSKAYEDVDPSYKERGGFMKYAEEQLGVGSRKAYNLVDIYYKFNLYGISGETVQSIGWTKASKIAAVMDDTNAEDLVALASENTVQDLVETIKESYVERGGEKGEKKLKIAFKFRLFEDQATAVKSAVEQARENLGLKTLDDAFEYIVMEWAAEHLDTKPAKAAAKATGKATGKAKVTG